MRYDTLVYLASPYSHPNPDVQEYRYKRTMEFVAANLKTKFLIYSPIVYCHPITVAHSLPGNAPAWRDHNRFMLEKCDQLWILCLKDWTDSQGIKQEIKWATALSLPIVHV